MEQNKKIPKGYRLKPETHSLIKKVQKILKGNTDDALNFACRNILKQLKNNIKGDSVMRIFILIFVLAVSSMNVYSQWTVQQFNPDYNSIFMVPSSSVGYAVSDYDGVMRKTMDGGLTWSVLSGGTIEGLNDLYFVNQNTGWCVGNLGTIMQTTNGGLNFSSQTSGVTNSLSSVQFIDANTGYIAYTLGKVLKTTNAGVNWSILTAAGSSLYASFFLNANVGWVGSFSGAVYWTTNGGSNWTTQVCTSAFTIMDIYFIDNTTGWCCESGGKVFKTTNSGTNWSQQTTGIVTELTSIHFYNSNTGVACGENGKVIRTTNGGTTWSEVYNNNGVYLTSLSVIDANNIIAAGYDGYIIKSSNTGVNWSVLYGASSGSIKSVYFTNTVTGFAIDNSGFIYKTSNGGSNWNSTQLLLETAFQVTFANPSTGWVSGLAPVVDGSNIPMLLKTSNGGSSWQAIALPGTNNTIEDMFFFGTNNGWLVSSNINDANYGTSTNLYITTNGGLNWGNPFNFSDQTLSLFFTSAAEGWASQVNGRIFKTTNGGLNWTQQLYLLTPDFTSIFFLNSNQGFVCGGNGVIMSTTNGGTNWTALTSGTTYQLNSIYFANNLNGICVGEVGTRLRTTNGGLNWLNSPEAVPIDLYAAYMVSTSNAYAAGEFGYITNLGGIVGVNNHTNEIPNEFSLSQNYPNPFNPETKINYQLPLSGMVKLSVFDITGKLVKELVNANQNAGSYEVNFDGSGLSSGIYFYKLETENFIQTKKMVLIK